MVVFVAQCAMAAPQCMEQGISDWVVSPPRRISPLNLRRHVPADVFLCPCKDTRVFVFILAEFAYVLVKNGVWSQIRKTVPHLGMLFLTWLSIVFLLCHLWFIKINLFILKIKKESVPRYAHKRKDTDRKWFKTTSSGRLSTTVIVPSSPSKSFAAIKLPRVTYRLCFCVI